MKQKINPEILFEDENYIIFNKPAGLVVHADGKAKEGTEPTLADWLIENRPEMKKVGEPLEIRSGSAADGTEKTETVLRPGIVHRLDKETSGAIVVAKTQAAFADLKLKFQNREVDKKYHVFVYGTPKEDDSTIDRPIGRSKNDFRKWSAQRGARGEMREALTNYRVIKRGKVPLESAHDENGVPIPRASGQGGPQAEQTITFIEAEPKTGRTHQIRVHLKAIHCPVVADSLYAPNHAPVLGFKRQALHARSVSFKGIAGKRITVEAPYPKDFEKALKEFEKVQ